MRFNGIIQRKLSLLDDRIIWLELNFASMSLGAFKESSISQAAAERGVQVAIEIMIDIAERLIALHGAGPAATAGDAIQKLYDLGIIKQTETYQKMVKFRNFIVHEYATVNPEIVHQIITTQLADFRIFRNEIDLVTTIDVPPHAKQ